MGWRAYGGPLDGREHVQGSDRAWAWLDAGDLRAYAEPSDLRALYLAVGDEWRYCGAGAYECAGCGALIGRPGRGVEGVDRERCPLCGHARQPGGGGAVA